MSLSSCAKCHRHLRADGAIACRFCGAARGAVEVSVAGGGRLSRSAAAAAAFSAALTVAGCNREAAQDSPPAAVYGAPPAMIEVADAASTVPAPPTPPKPKAEDPKPTPQPTLVAPAYGAPPPANRP